MYNDIIYHVENHVATITLNRPKVYHALNGDIMTEITDAISKAAADENARAVVLTAEGNTAFCSGADLKAGVASGNTELGDTLKQFYNPMITAIREIEKPVIGRLNGIAAGAGMSLALACDIIIAQQEAYMTELFVGIGLMPDAGSMFFLPRIVGMQRAFELCSTGRKVHMEEALQLGLVSKVVPFEHLDTAVKQLTDYYVHAATRSIGLMKKVLNKSLNSSLEEVLNMEAENQTKLGHSHDFAEGVMAFLQKRKPEFKGK
ncbi:MAG: enoyl-CoA hydratase-related protein [Spirosomaceae bacterium]|nr:enoyl-CoA hydratase-related protein [Spirosomataceae bacterium]